MVLLRRGVERIIPIGSTSVSPDPIREYALPLDQFSVKQLVKVFSRIVAVKTESIEPPTQEQEDERVKSTERQSIEPTTTEDNHHITTSGRTAEQQGVRPEEVCSRAGLEHPDSSTTTAGFSDTCQELPDPFAPSTKSRAKGERK